jgi:hypothetical protein
MNTNRSSGTGYMLYLVTFSGRLAVSENHWSCGLSMLSSQPVELRYILNSGRFVSSFLFFAESNLWTLLMFSTKDLLEWRCEELHRIHLPSSEDHGDSCFYHFYPHNGKPSMLLQYLFIRVSDRNTRHQIVLFSANVPVLISLILVCEFIYILGLLHIDLLPLPL